MNYSSITDPKPKKGKATLHFKMGKSKRSYQSADVRTGHKDYGPESKTKPTPGHVVKAQAAGAETSEHGGRSYRAGYTSIEKTPHEFSVHIEKTKPVIPTPKKGAYETMQTRQNTEKIRQKSAPGPKQRRPRVEYLQGHGYGRNKRTESGH